LLHEDGWQHELRATAAEPGVVRIAGTLSRDAADVLQRWRATAKRIETDVPLRRLIVELDEPSAQAKSDASSGALLRIPVPRPSSPPPLSGRVLPILDVRVAHDRVITLIDGRQVSVGGWLPDGSRVEEIDLEHTVVRTTSGQRMIIPYGTGG
jgi:hypothetical protein